MEAELPPNQPPEATPPPIPVRERRSPLDRRAAASRRQPRRSYLSFVELYLAKLRLQAGWRRPPGANSSL